MYKTRIYYKYNDYNIINLTLIFQVSYKKGYIIPNDESKYFFNGNGINVFIIDIAKNIIEKKEYDIPLKQYLKVVK